MASVPPRQTHPENGQAPNVNSSSQFTHHYQSEQRQASSSSGGYAPQTAVPPHLTQLNPGVVQNNNPHQLRQPPPTAVPPMSMAPTQPQQSSSSSNIAPGNVAYTINQQEQMNRQALDSQRRVNELQAHHNALAAALQTALQEKQIQQRNYANLLTSWNEYKDANDAYKAEHDRDTRRVKDLEETLAAKEKLVEQGWAAMATWKEAAQKEEKKREDAELRMAKVVEQLNQMHLEGMQWKACALSWNDPKGEFQQALVHAITVKLGEQYAAKERVLLERNRELEHQVQAYRQLYPDAQLPPLPPAPAPQPQPQRNVSHPHPQPQTRPVPPPINTAPSPTARRDSSTSAPTLTTTTATFATAQSQSPYAASPAAMQAHLQHQYNMQQRMVQQQQQAGSRSSTTPSQQQQQHPHQQPQRGANALPQTPTTAPIPSTRTFATPQQQQQQQLANGSGSAGRRQAVRIVTPTTSLHFPQASPPTSRRASLPNPSPQQAFPQRHTTTTTPGHQQQHPPPPNPNPQQFVIATLQRQNGSVSAGSLSSSSLPTGQSPLYLPNGRQAGFVAPKAVPQKRSSSSSSFPPQQEQRLQQQVRELALDDVIVIPDDDDDVNVEEEEGQRASKRARVDGWEREGSPDVPLALARSVGLGMSASASASAEGVESGGVAMFGSPASGTTGTLQEPGRAQLLHASGTGAVQQQQVVSSNLQQETRSGTLQQQPGSGTPQQQLEFSIPQQHPAPGVLQPSLGGTSQDPPGLEALHMQSKSGIPQQLAPSDESPQPPPALVTPQSLPPALVPTSPPSTLHAPPPSTDVPRSAVSQPATPQIAQHPPLAPQSMPLPTPPPSSVQSVPSVPTYNPYLEAITRNRRADSNATVVPAAVVGEEEETEMAAPVTVARKEVSVALEEETGAPPTAVEGPDDSPSPPMMSPGLSSHRPTPELGRLVPITLALASERIKCEDEEDELDTVEEEDVAMSSEEDRSEATTMDVDKPIASGNAEATSLKDIPQTHQQYPPSLQDPVSPCLPGPPPIAVLPPDRQLSPSPTEPGELKESPARRIKSEIVGDEGEERIGRRRSLEEGEVRSTAAQTPNVPLVSQGADVTMEDADHAEPEDVKPDVGRTAGSEVVPKIEEMNASGASGGKDVTAPTSNGATFDNVHGSQEKPIEVVEERNLDSIILDFLTLVFGKVENDPGKVRCLLCGKKGKGVDSSETFPDDISVCVRHCEQHHPRAWRIKVLQILAELGIPYVRPAPTAA